MQTGFRLWLLRNNLKPLTPPTGQGQTLANGGLTDTDGLCRGKRKNNFSSRIAYTLLSFTGGREIINHHRPRITWATVDLYNEKIHKLSIEMTPISTPALTQLPTAAAITAELTRDNVRQYFSLQRAHICTRGPAQERVTCKVHSLATKAYHYSYYTSFCSSTLYNPLLIHSDTMKTPIHPFETISSTLGLWKHI